MKKLLAIALLISMGQLCAMEACELSTEEQWMLESVDPARIAEVGQLVADRGNTGEDVGYWLDQLASFHENDCTNGQLRAFERYFENGNELECRKHFKESHLVAPAAMPSLSSPVSPPASAVLGGGSPSSSSTSGRLSSRPLINTNKARRFLGISKLQYLAAMSGTALVVGGALATHRHIKVRHAKGEKTVFDRMGRWVQQRYRGLARREKTTSETSA